MWGPDSDYIDCYKWANLLPGSPLPSTRNMWLWYHGAFAAYKGLWFPVRIVQWNTIGEPLLLASIPHVSGNLDYSIYPATVLASECDALYSVFNTGLSLLQYVQDKIELMNLANQRVQEAVIRSLTTSIVSAHPRVMRQVKGILNQEFKGEHRVVSTKTMGDKDSIQVLELPDTHDKLPNLKMIYLWARQEKMVMLGFNYNPETGKRERVLQAEVDAQNELVKSHRHLITNRLLYAAAFNNEYVEHMADFEETVRMYNAEQVYVTAEGITGSENERGVLYVSRNP